MVHVINVGILQEWEEKKYKISNCHSPFSMSAFILPFLFIYFIFLVFHKDSPLFKLIHFILLPVFSFLHIFIVVIIKIYLLLTWYFRFDNRNLSSTFLTFLHLSCSFFNFFKLLAIFPKQITTIFLYFISYRFITFLALFCSFIIISRSVSFSFLS